MRNRISKLIVTVLAAVMVTGILSAVALAAETPSTPITLDLKDIDIRQAVEVLFRGTGINFTVDQDVQGTIPTFVVKEVPFDQALKVLCKIAGLTYRQDGNIYLIQKKQAVPEVTQPVQQDTSVEVEATTTEETTIDKIPLNNTGATELLGMMNGQTSNNNSSFGGSSFGGFGNSGFGGGFGNSGFNSGFGGGFGSSYGGGFGSSYGGGSYGSSYGGGGFGGSYGGFGGSYGRSF